MSPYFPASQYPRVKYTGAIIIGFGAPTDVDIWYQRISGCLWMMGSFRAGAIDAATTATVSLPSVVALDHDGIVPKIVGKFTRGNASGGLIKGGFMTVFDNASVLTFCWIDTASATSPLQGPLLSTSIASNSERFSFDALIPIEGWGA